VSRRMSPKTPLASAAPPLTGAPPATRATPSRSMPAGHREGVCLDLEEVFSAGVTVGRTAPVQTARHRKGRCGVWSARDRLQPDPPGQSAPSRGDGGSVSSALPRGVANCTAKSLNNCPKRPRRALLAALGVEINEKLAFAWGKRASCCGFSANS
jgi:hypothetical protein